MKRIISMGGVFAASLFLGLAFCPCVMPHESLAFDSNSIRPVHGEYVPGELLVKFRADAPRAAREDLHRRHGLTRLKEFKRLRIDRVKITDQLSMEEAIGQYAQDPSVEYAEPNYLVQSQVFPNDIRFTELWGLSNTGQTGGTPGADIRAPQAWGITTGSSTTVVAVIDSGIDYSHPDLAPNMWVNEKELNGKPGVDDDGNGYIDDIYGINAITNNGDLMDDCGHGTHVSGTIGAAGNNSIGVVGVNWNVKIIGCKFLDWSGSGSTADALECLEYVKALKDRGVNIVATNNSWGGGGYSSSMYEAIRAQGDILFVAAAGNSAFDADEYAFYPAAYELPNVVSVAATDYNDAKASFSNYGRRTIYVGAPGDEILSTLPGGSYGAYSGTSMATPHVTGLAALLKSQDQGRDWKAIKNLILSGGDDLASMDTGTVTGKRISAYGSVTCSDRPVFSALRFPEEVGPGEQIVLSALSINCESPVGPVTVLSSSGEQIGLADDGVAPDLAAGDGVFTASWTPIRSFAYLDFSSAAGTERVILELGIATSSLPPGSANKKYSQTLIASGGVPPYTWSIVSGSLPAGLSLNAATGEIAGTPVSGGISTFTVQLTDAVPASDTKTLSLTIAGSAADLAVTSVTGPQTALAGGQAAVTARITNQGNRAAGPFSVGFYLSYDTTITTTDIFIGSVPVSSLSRRGQYNATATLSIPPTVASGTYFIGAIADYQGTVSEFDKQNNALSGNQITISQAPSDLVVSALSGPSGAGTGQQASVSITVRNSGQGIAPATFAGIYLSTDSVISSTDTPIGYVYFDSLMPGAQQAVTATATVPAGMLPGTYYLGAIADIFNAAAESNENNNIIASGQFTVAGPDLLVQSVSGPSGAATGQQASVTVTVRNSGQGVAPATYAGIYLSTDSTVSSTADTQIGYVSLGSLAPATQQTVTATVTVPVGMLPGTYYLGAVADIYSAAAESNEGNNATVAGQLTVAGPDLLVLSVSGPSSAATGQQASVTVTVRNSGQGIAPATYAGIYLSTDNTISSTADTQIGYVSLGSLAPATQQTVTATVTIPAGMLPGTYYLGAVADIYSAAAESNEGNNAAVAEQFTVAGPDLVVLSVSGPSSAAIGQQASVTVTVRNSGQGAAPATYAGIYLSTDNTISSTADTQIGYAYFGSLAPNVEQTVTATVTVPVGMLPGTYYLGAVADIYNAAAESSEGNNATVAGQLTVSNPVTGPDLVVLSVSGPSGTGTGQQASVTVTVRNAGQGGAPATYAGVYLSTDNTISSTADTQIGYAYFGSLAAGAQQAVTVTVTIPAGMLPGTYYLGAITDIYNAAAESNEGNNATAAGQFAVTGPDLVVLSVSGPSGAGTGQQASVTVTVRNAGQGVAPATFASIHLSADSITSGTDTSIGHAYFASMAPGAQQTVTATVTIPAGMIPGTYYLGAVADTFNAAAEDNENNNTMTSGQFAVTGPDLVVLSVSGPSGAGTGQQVSVTVTVRNAGQGVAPATFASIHLSADSITSGTDTSIGYAYFASLAPGAQQAIAATVTIPAGVLPGAYYLGAIADTFNAAAEDNENNNTMTSGQFTVTGP